jgi:hypothetical protein
VIPSPSVLAVTVEQGPLRWAAAPAAWAVVLILAAVALVVRAVYVREEGRIPGPMRALLAGLRLLAVALVLATLFRPFREETQKAEDKSHLVVLVDASASMRTVDRYRAEDERRVLDAAWPPDGRDRRPSELKAPRLELVQRVLAPEGGTILSRLADRFVLHVFAFDEDLRWVGSTDPSDAAGEGGTELTDRERLDAMGRALRALKPDGGRTEIGPALLGVARDVLGREDRRLAGVVLLSDGRDNSETQRPLEALSRLGRSAEELRVTAVALGDPSLAKNLKVDHVSAKDWVLVQDRVTFRIDLRQTGFDGVEDVDVKIEIEQIAGKDGKTLPRRREYSPPGNDPMARTQASVRLQPSDRTTPVLLRAQFTEAGEFDVKVRATLPPSLRREDAVPEDDVKVHHIRVQDQTIRVLLSDHVLRHEAHFLKNLLVRESRHEGDPRRIDAQVWIQSFDPNVDQPHSRALPALRTFPNTKAEIFAYDVIILGDVAWRQLATTEDQSKRILALLKDFVAEGGGLAFVAGEDHDPENLADTVLGDLLPVVVGGVDRGREPSRSAAFRVAPTEAGRAHPILSVLQESPEAVERAWRENAGWSWYWLYRATGGLKPGAFALARVAGVSSDEYRDDRGELLPVFAGMSYGKGRTFFSAIDQIFRIRREYGDVYYGSFWDETIRWLATYRLLGGNKRYKIETDKEKYFVGDRATIRISALDTDYSPLKVPKLAGVQVEDPDGKGLLGPGDEPVPDAESPPGTYRTQVLLPRSGRYRVTVEPPTRDGGERAEKPIEVQFATKEDQDTVPDHETLAAVVKAANPPGEARPLVRLWELPATLDALPARAVERVLDRRDVQLWDSGTTLWVVVGVLALEWLLRKRYQLI